LCAPGRAGPESQSHSRRSSGPRLSQPAQVSTNTVPFPVRPPLHRAPTPLTHATSGRHHQALAGQQPRDRHLHFLCGRAWECARCRRPSRMADETVQLYSYRMPCSPPTRAMPLDLLLTEPVQARIPLRRPSPTHTPTHMHTPTHTPMPTSTLTACPCPPT
jgi:hypothetical protein